MHLGKFHRAIYNFQEDFESLNILEELQQLQSILQQSISQPNQPNSQAFKEQYTKLIQILESCETNDASPTQRKIFDTIGASENIGTILASQITKIIADNNLAPAEALAEITKLHQRVREYYTTITEIVNRFDSLKIEYDYLEENEAEIGLSFPPELVQSNLKGLEDEIHEIDRTFRTFKEVTGDDVSSIKLRTISSTDFQFFLDSAPAVAACVATALERIVALYRNLLEIKKIRQDLSKKSLPKKVTQPIENYETEYIESELEKVSDSLLKEHYKGDTGRKNELKTALTKALRYLADRIDNGALVEVRVGEPEEPEEETTDEGTKVNQKKLKAYEEQKKLVDSINAKGRSLTQIGKAQKSILKLETSSQKTGDSSEET